MKKKVDKELNKLKVSLIDRKNRLYRFSKLKYSANNRLQISLIDEIFNKKFLGFECIFGNPLPKNISELRTTNFLLYENDLEKEICWNSLIIEKFSDKINNYIVLMDKFEKSIIVGNYNIGDDILNSIENNICVSICGIENRFLLEEYSNGVEKNKKKLSEINKMVNNDILSILCDFLSNKVEKNSSFDNYKIRLKEFLKEGTIYKAIYDYLIFRLDKFNDFNDSALANALFIESTSSIIDRYNSLIKVLQIIYSSKNIDIKIKQSADRAIEILSKSINDSRLIRMATIRKLNINIKVDDLTSKFSIISDSYTNGDYLNCFDLIKNELNNNANIFELYEYFVKSIMFLNYSLNNLIYEDNIKNTIIKNMYKLYIKDEDTINAANELLNLAKTLSEWNMGSQIKNFVENRISKNCFDKTSILSELNSNVINPRLCLAFENYEDSIRYLVKLSELGIANTTVQLFIYNLDLENNISDGKIYIKGQIKIDEIRKILYEAKAYKNKKVYEKAICLYEKIINEKINLLNKTIKRYILEKVLVDLFEIYLDKNEILKCINILVDNYFYVEYIIIRMNKNSLYNRIEASKSNEINSNIKTSIFYYIYDRKAFKKLHYLYACFLNNIGIEKPSQLFNISYKFNKTELIFFLHKICIKEVMKSSVEFDSIDKVIEERLSILWFLKDWDNDNKKYINEIREISQIINTKQRIKCVNESKIYVDVNGLKDSIKEVYLEKFNRYNKLSNIDNEYILIDIYDKNIQKSLSDLDNNFVKHMNSQKYILFKELFIYLRNEFLFNNTYGLDNFLGSRIRHGCLYFALIKNFTKHNLFSSKIDEKSDNYDLNIYWDQKVSDAIKKTNEYSLFKHALSEFSRKINDKINEINKKWIRIKTEEKNIDGMIDFSFSEKILYAAFDIVNSINDKDIFFEQIIDYFWYIVNNGLEKIRYRINNELKTSLIYFLKELEINLNQIKTGEFYDKYLKEVYNDINICKANLSVNLNSISQWFIKKSDIEYLDFNMNDLLDTCIQINNQIYYKDENIKIKRSINNNIIFSGDVFIYFMDILNILYLNALTHSGFDRTEDMLIYIIVDEMTKDDIENSGMKFHDDYVPTNFISITFKNKLSKKIDTDKLFSKMKDIIKDLNNFEKVKDLSSCDRGSGYYKIKKILSYNLKKAYHGIFVNVENNTFTVQILIEREKVVVDN